MPKFIVCAVGRPVFLPRLVAVLFRRTAGRETICATSRTPTTASMAPTPARAWSPFITRDRQRERRGRKYSWTFDNDGSIRVKTSQTVPKRSSSGRPTIPTARDFRLMTIGRAFKSHSSQRPGGRRLRRARSTTPEHGWTASFVELTYDVGHPYPLKVTTAVRITPDTLPHRDIDPTKAPYESRQVNGKKSKPHGWLTAVKTAGICASDRRTDGLPQCLPPHDESADAARHPPFGLRSPCESTAGEGIASESTLCSERLSWSGFDRACCLVRDRRIGVVHRTVLRPRQPARPNSARRRPRPTSRRPDSRRSLGLHESQGPVDRHARSALREDSACSTTARIGWLW